MAYIPAHQRPALENVYIPRRFSEMRINYHNLTILQKPTITIAAGVRMQTAWTLVWDDFKPQISLLLRHTALLDAVAQFQHHYEGYSSSRSLLQQGLRNGSAQDAQIRNLSHHLVGMNDTLDHVLRHGIYAYIHKLLPGPYQHLDKKLWARLTQLEWRHGVLTTAEVNLEALSQQVDREREEAERLYAEQLLLDQQQQQVLNWVTEDHGWGEAPPNDKNVPPPPGYSPRHTPQPTPPLDPIDIPLNDLYKPAADQEFDAALHLATRVHRISVARAIPIIAAGGPHYSAAVQAAARNALNLDVGAQNVEAPLENRAPTEGELTEAPIVID